MPKNDNSQPYPNGFAKINHNLINIHEILRKWTANGEAVPESVANLHIDLEVNSGRFDSHPVYYWRTCWKWSHERVKKLLTHRQFIDNLSTIYRQSKSIETNTCDTESTTDRQSIDNSSTGIKEKEQEEENIGELFAEIWTLYPGRWRPNERPKKGSKQDALKVFKRFAKDGARILEAVKNAKAELSGKRESFLPDLHRFIGKEIYLDYLDAKTEKQQPELTPAQQRALFAEREAKVKR